MKKVFFVLPLILIAGCFQVYNDDDDLRTVPITNNPTIMPSTGSGLPSMGGQY